MHVITVFDQNGMVIIKIEVELIFPLFTLTIVNSYYEPGRGFCIYLVYLVITPSEQFFIMSTTQVGRKSVDTGGI